MKSYRPQSPLEKFIVTLVVGVYDRHETPVVYDITTLVITDPRFMMTIMNNPNEAAWVTRYGAERAVRNVLQTIRFTGGRYKGKRACLLVPVPGRKAGYMQFTSRLTVHELELIRDRMGERARALVQARNEVEGMINDLIQAGADRLEQIYPPGDMAVGL